MADSKISNLSAVTNVLSTDEYVLARSGASNKITAANLAAGFTTTSTLFAATETADVTVSSTTEGTPTSVLSLGSQTYAAVSTIIEFFCPAVASSSGAIVCIGELWADGTYLCRWFDVRLTSSSDQQPVCARFRLTPSAASHTYEVRAFKSGAGTVTMSGGAGTGGTGVYAPMLLTASLG